MPNIKDSKLNLVNSNPKNIQSMVNGLIGGVGGLDFKAVLVVMSDQSFDQKFENWKFGFHQGQNSKPFRTLRINKMQKILMNINSFLKIW